MSVNNMKNYKEEINDINKRLNDIINYADSKKGFFNNVFFPEKEKPIPMNLFNISYNSSSKDFSLDNTETFLKQFNFDEPDKIFLLPSSDDSGNESKNKFIPSFSQICDDIIDLEYVELLKDEKDLPKGIYPLVLFRRKEPLTNANNVLNFVKSCIKNDPYEIKIGQIPSNENKDTLSLFVKFYNYEDAKTVIECLKKTYNVTGRLCYDKRESIDSKWYCVVFRMEGGGDQKLSKFISLMDDIFKTITDPKKKFLATTIESSCEGQIDDVKCIKKFGEVFFCAIRVSNLEQALTLCVKYNNNQGLKANLHNLSNKMKKSEKPHILTHKEEIGEKRFYKNKFNKTYKEDGIYQNEAAQLLFPSRRMLNKKHKRNKNKQQS